MDFPHCAMWQYHNTIVHGDTMEAQAQILLTQLHVKYDNNMVCLLKTPPSSFLGSTTFSTTPLHNAYNYPAIICSAGYALFKKPSLSAPT